MIHALTTSRAVRALGAAAGLALGAMALPTGADALCDTGDVYRAQQEARATAGPDAYAAKFLEMHVVPNAPADTQAVWQFVAIAGMTPEAAIDQHIERFHDGASDDEIAGIRESIAVNLAHFGKIASLLKVYEFTDLDPEVPREFMRTNETNPFEARGKDRAHFVDFFDRRYQTYRSTKSETEAVARAFSEAIVERNVAKGGDRDPTCVEWDYVRTVNYLRRLQFAQRHPATPEQHAYVQKLIDDRKIWAGNIDFRMLSELDMALIEYAMLDEAQETAALRSGYGFRLVEQASDALRP